MVKRTLLTVAICAALFWRLHADDPYVRFHVLDHLASNLYFKDLSTVERDPLKIDRSLFKKYVHYFEFVARYLPGRADAYAMAGFCQAQLGKSKEALVDYQKAAAFKPQATWVYYNLGLLYLKAGDGPQARAYFQKAAIVPGLASINFLENSKIYLDILREAPGTNIADRLQTTYALSYRLATAPEPDFKKANVLSLRIF